MRKKSIRVYKSRIVGSLVLAFVLGLGVMAILNKTIFKPDEIVKYVEVEKKQVGDVVFENDQVKIEYIQVNKDMWDLYVEPKNEMQVISNFDMDTRVNEVDAYLTGRTRKEAKRTYDKVKAQFPDSIDWEFRWQGE